MKRLFLVISIISLILFSACNDTIVVPNDGVQDVAIQDQNSEVIDLKLFIISDNLTLLKNYSIGDRYINISSNTAPIVGDIVCLKDKTGTAFLQDKILNVTSLGGNNYQLYLRMPLDFPYTTEDGCSHGSTNWAVDGSVTPKYFSVSPELNINTTKWDIIRITFVCLGDGMSNPSDTKPDSTAFFTMDPITNGAYLRTVNGITKNIFAVQSNSEMQQHTGGDLFINTELNKNGLYSVIGRRTFNGFDKNGVTLRLEALTSDRIEWVIQDNLLAMTLCETNVQGHIVEN